MTMMMIMIMMMMQAQKSSVGTHYTTLLLRWRIVVDGQLARHVVSTSCCPQATVAIAITVVI
jgi:hypothetical protein